MSYPHFDLVEKAHQDLKAEGLIKPRGSQEEVEQDKGLMTRRAAWYINQQRDPSHGLLEKTSGNNSQGYSVDWILRQTDGVGWDVATDNGSEALPVNGDQHPPDASYIPRWRPPTAELAQMPDGQPEPGPDPGPEPGPEPVPPADNSEELKALTDAVNALQVIVLQQGEMIHHMMTQTWHGECRLGVNMRFGVTCPPMPST